MSNYIVTGAAGFIASRVCHQLLQQGHHILALDNLNDAYDVKLKHHRLEPLLKNPNFEFQKLDIETINQAAAGDTESVDGTPEVELVSPERGRGTRAANSSSIDNIDKILDKFGQVDAVINLAARAGVPVSVQNPWVYLTTNTTGTLNLLDLAIRHHIPKFVLASTSSLYGKHNPLPYSEDANTDTPLSPYAASKKGAEAMAYTYHYLYGLDVSICRYFTVYGPAGRPDMSIFRFARWIIEGDPIQLTGDGTQSRDFTYVDDIARGTILATKPVGYQIINLGSDHPYTLNQMIALLEQHTGQRARVTYLPAPHTDMEATWADVTKARLLLGWKSEVTFEQGLHNLVQWYYDNRELASTITLPTLF
jgi:nucleoside-diphosphate-sugar epimerase